MIAFTYITKAELAAIDVVAVPHALINASINSAFKLPAPLPRLFGGVGREELNIIITSTISLFHDSTRERTTSRYQTRPAYHISLVIFADRKYNPEQFSSFSRESNSAFQDGMKKGLPRIVAPNPRAAWLLLYASCAATEGNAYLLVD